MLGVDRDLAFVPQLAHAAHAFGEDVHVDVVHGNALVDEVLDEPHRLARIPREEAFHIPLDLRFVAMLARLSRRCVATPRSVACRAHAFLRACYEAFDSGQLVGGKGAPRAFTDELEMVDDVRCNLVVGRAPAQDAFHEREQPCGVAAYDQIVVQDVGGVEEIDVVARVAADDLLHARAARDEAFRCAVFLALEGGVDEVLELLGVVYP